MNRILAALILAGALVACGDNGGSKPAPKNQAPSPTFESGEKVAAPPAPQDEFLQAAKPSAYVDPIWVANLRREKDVRQLPEKLSYELLENGGITAWSLRDVSTFGNVLSSYSCFEGGDEFAQRRYLTDVEAKLKSFLASVKPEPFKRTFKVTFSDYDFSKGGYQLYSGSGAAGEYQFSGWADASRSFFEGYSKWDRNIPRTDFTVSLAELMTIANDCAFKLSNVNQTTSVRQDEPVRFDGFLPVDAATAEAWAKKFDWGANSLNKNLLLEVNVMPTSGRWVQYNMFDSGMVRPQVDVKLISWRLLLPDGTVLKQSSE